MSETTALAVLTLLAGYFALGVLFAVPFVCFGLTRVDAATAHSSVGFRLTILLGVALFWPLLALRWHRGGGTPPDERSAHIVASSKKRP